MSRGAAERPELRGVIVAAITPRRRNSTEIDIAAALDLMDYISARKPQGIVLLGSTGEFVHFAVSERIRLVHMAIKRSRVPVVVNVSHSTLDGALQLAEEAADSGAAALLLTPPYYFQYGAAEVEAFYHEFARELDRDLPLLLYHIPAFAPGIPPDVAQRLLSDGRYAGIKDSGGEWEYTEQLCQLRQQQKFTLLIGSDGLYVRGRLMGADGVVSGTACAIPELLLALERTLQSEDVAERARLEARLQDFLAWLPRFPVPLGVKEATGLRKINIGARAIPLASETEQLLAQFRNWCAGWLDDVLRECRNA